MSLIITPARSRQGHSFYIFDSGILETVTNTDFDPTAFAASGTLTGEAQGRGTAWFVELAGLPCVLRHYRRGGLVANLSKDQYCWTGLDHNRAWQEWRLLQFMAEAGLPVPLPVAARVQRNGLFYRADIITRLIPDSGSLAQHLSEKPLSAANWGKTGAVLRRFHDGGVYHSDLNAHNILIDRHEAVFLIDFDKGRLRKAEGRWRQETLLRLRRSLLKLQGESAIFHFDEGCWQKLLDGYDG